MALQFAKICIPLALTVVACGGAPASKTPESSPLSAESKDETPHSSAKAGVAEDQALLAALPAAKLDLVQGIALAERQGGVAISAKFELEDGKLSLSVYTARKGLDADAEHNELSELMFDPTLPEQQPKEEVFADAKHLARASYHLTIVQRSQLSLAKVIAKALAEQPGQVYSVEPAAHERAPIFHVRIAMPGGGEKTVDVQGGA